MTERAVILLSGGMDSATCLALARRAGHQCHTLSFAYGQRHDSELAAAAKLADSLGAVEHRVMTIDLAAFGGSALTDARIAIPGAGGGSGIPVTYVPARNTLFLSFALALAEVLDADWIYAGMNAVDYSGYPDCRPAYIRAFQTMADLATRRAVEGRPVCVHTPLLDMSKAEIIRTGTELGVDFSQTVSCYQADASGAACGNCDACALRLAGFAAAGIADPTRYAGPPPGAR